MRRIAILVLLVTAAFAQDGRDRYAIGAFTPPCDQVRAVLENLVH